tara:strand:- start:3594 stop:4829 length:1236 start_codon:yes stop_codon:yes gene_type:complete
LKYVLFGFLLSLALSISCSNIIQNSDDGVYFNAPELSNITHWVNSDGFTLKSKKGKVILIDFYTYTCVNCIRTYPYIKKWHQKYEPYGLVVLGVHSPEFEFEKKIENIKTSAEFHGLKYPIAVDNKRGTWDAFSNRYWPAKYLIDARGKLRYSHFGEGYYSETEQQIQELLIEAGADLSDIPLVQTSEVISTSFFKITGPENNLTRELYAGYNRNSLKVRNLKWMNNNSDESFEGDDSELVFNRMDDFENVLNQPYIVQRNYYDNPLGTIVDYTHDSELINNFLYITGRWKSKNESLIHGRETLNFEDNISLKFCASTANVVVGKGNNQDPYLIKVTLDGMPIDEVDLGDDLFIGEDGNTYIQVNEDKMFNIFQSKTSHFDCHKLQISANSQEFEVFAFTFSPSTDYVELQ